MATADEILSGNLPEETTGAPVETTEETTTETETTETAAEETTEATEKTETTEPPSETTEPATIAISAYHGVRDELNGVKSDFKAYQEAHPEAAEVRPDVFEDPNKAFEYSEDKLSNRMTEAFLTEGKGEAVLQYDQETVDNAESWFIEKAKDSPLLVEQMRKIPPMQQHRWFVKIHQADQSRVDQSDPAAYRASMKEEVRLELEAEAKAATEKGENTRSSLPKSLVGDASEGGLTSQDTTTPTSLEERIGRGA